MDKPDLAMAQQVDPSAGDSEQPGTGHMPKAVTVLLRGDTLVIMAHGALSPAEKAFVQSPAGAAQMAEYHRQLFANAADAVRWERPTSS